MIVSKLKKLITSSSILFISNLIYRGSTFILTFLLVHILDEESFGDYAYLQSIVAILVVFCSYGFNITFIREFSQFINLRNLKKYFLISLISSFVFGLLFYAVNEQFLHFDGSIIVTITLVFITNVIIGNYRYLCLARISSIPLIILDLLSFLTKVLLLLIVYFFVEEQKFLSSLFAILVSNGIVILVGVFLFRKANSLIVSAKVDWDITWTKEFAITALTTILISFGFTVFTHVDRFMIGNMVSLNHVGKYALILVLVEISAIVHSSVTNLFMPGIVKFLRTEDLVSLKGYYTSARNLSFLINCIYFLLCFLLIEVVFFNVFKKTFDKKEIFITFSFLVMSKMVSFSFGPMSSLLLMKKEIGFELMITILKIVLNICGNFLLIRLYGFVGCAISTFVITFILHNIQYQKVKRDVRISFLSWKTFLFLSVLMIIAGLRYVEFPMTFLYGLSLVYMFVISFSYKRSLMELFTKNLKNANL